MKNKFIICLATLMAFSSFSLTSCDETKVTTETRDIPCKISLNQTSFDVMVGDQIRLDTQISGGTQEDELTFVSSDTTIANVDNVGNISTYKPGDCEITVKYGDVSEKAQIHVIFENNSALIKFKNITDNEITIDTSTRLPLYPVIIYNNHEYEFNPSFEVSSVAIGSVEDGIFIPKRSGVTFINVRGSLFGKPVISYSLLVNVREDAAIFMKEKNGHEFNEIHLFSNSTYKGIESQTSFIPEFGVFSGGRVVENPALTIVLENPDNVVLHNPTTHELQSTTKDGEARFVVTYKDSKNNTFIKTFKVYNNRSIYDYSDDLFEIDSVSGELPINDIFADFDKEITKVTSLDGTSEFTVSNNKIIGVPSLVDQDGNVIEQTIIVYNNLVGFKVRVLVFDKIIKTASDLDYFNMTTGNEVFDGNYVVVNDIDGQNYAVKKQYRFNGGAFNGFPNVGFIGKLDGRGHTISNFSVAEDGIFGNIGIGAVIKNLAITNVSFRKNDGPSNDDTTLFAGYINGATFENVYVANDVIDGNNNASLLANCFTSSTVFRNCLFVLEQDVKNNPIVSKNYGVLASFYGEYNSASSFKGFIDTYIISKTPAIYSTSYSQTGKIIVDASNFDYEEDGYARYNFPSLLHYKTDQDMKDANLDFSNFSNNYWEVNDGLLSWSGK